MPSEHICKIMTERLNNEFCELMTADVDCCVGYYELSPAWRVAHTQGPADTGIDYAKHLPRVYANNGHVAWPKEDGTGINTNQARAALEDFCLFAH